MFGKLILYFWHIDPFSLLCMILSWGVSLAIITTVPKDTVDSQEIQQLEISSPIIDKIELKQKEMRDTIVFVQTINGGGSGTIIDCLETDEKDIFEYFVLTNEHVVSSRFVTYLRSVNALTGKREIETIDMGCEIITFDHENEDWNRWYAEVLAEDTQFDLAILSFRSDQKYRIAALADNKMLKQVRVFDEIIAIGCQLGHAPTPTTGIIAQILTGDNGEKEWIVYANTAQISPGSSGGGLFREFNGHYYLIGIPYSVAVAPNGQFIPHLAYAISLLTARDFIDQNLITYAD